MRRSKPSLCKHADINITSLIDVVFILVIFFMIGSSFDKAGFSVHLPESSQVVSVKKEMIVVTVGVGGTIQIDDIEVKESDIVFVIRECLQENSSKSVSLFCDGAVPLNTVTRIMDKLAEGGAENVTIRAKQSPFQ